MVVPKRNQLKKNEEERREKKKDRSLCASICINDKRTAARVSKRIGSRAQRKVFGCQYTFFLQ